MSKLIEIGPVLPSFLGIVYGPPGAVEAPVIASMQALPAPKKGKPKKPGTPLNGALVGKTQSGRPLLRKKVF